MHNFLFTMPNEKIGCRNISMYFHLICPQTFIWSSGTTIERLLAYEFRTFSYLLPIVGPRRVILYYIITMCQLEIRLTKLVMLLFLLIVSVTIVILFCPHIEMSCSLAYIAMTSLIALDFVQLLTEESHPLTSSWHILTSINVTRMILGAAPLTSSGVHTTVCHQRRYSMIH